MCRLCVAIVFLALVMMVLFYQTGSAEKLSSIQTGSAEKLSSIQPVRRVYSECHVTKASYQRSSIMANHRGKRMLVRCVYQSYNVRTAEGDQLTYNTECIPNNWSPLEYTEGETYECRLTSERDRVIRMG